MSSWKLITPVAFIIFNRPQTTLRVFSEIAKAKPLKLLVVADGPRPDRAGEAAKCAEVRAILSRVNWDCEVITNFSESNMGCRRRVSSGIDWVFNTVEEAIILEDDCLPNPSFFRFCDQMLERFRDDLRIAQIGGVNFQREPPRGGSSYYFSRYNHIWGWASWRRAWKHYDVDLTLWPEIRDSSWLEDILGDARLVRKWRSIFEAVAAGKIDTWDYQWAFACWVNSALTVLPHVNLISNIGFGPAATHTRGWSRMAELETFDIGHPIRHPGTVIRDARADSFTESFENESILRRILTSVRRVRP